MNIAANMISGFRRVFSSIRVRFLTFFLIALMISLAAAELSLHTVTEDVMVRMSERTTLAELSQICDQIRGEAQSLRRQMTILELDGDVQALMNRSLFSRLERVEIQRSFQATVDALFVSFPMIQSVTLCSEDGYLLFVSHHSCRLYGPEEGGWPLPQKVMDQPRGRLMFYGGEQVPSDVFTLSRATTTRRLLCAGTRLEDGALLLSFDEALFTDQFSALAQLEGRSVSLLDAEGTVLCSSRPETVDQPYEGPSGAGALAFRGELKDEGLQVVYQVVAGEGYQEELTHLSRMTWLSLFVALSVTAVIFLIWLNRVLRPVTGIVESMKQVEQGDYSHRVDAPGMDELSKLAREYNGMLGSLQLLTELNAGAEQRRRESELQALRNQINPHFLCNTLNTIKWMAMMEGNQKVADSLGALGGLLSPLIRAKNSLCPLSEELDLSRRYLSLMNARYMALVPLKTEIPEELMDAAVPRLCLQPILENSIVHGFAPRRRWGSLLIRAERERDWMWIDVVDDGAGMAPEALAELNRRLEAGERCEHVGVVNTSMRIRLHFGDGCGIGVYENPGGGLRVRLTLRYRTAISE